MKTSVTSRRRAFPPSACGGRSSRISARRRGLELLAEKRLAVSSLVWAGGFTGSDGRTYKESVTDGQDAIRLAAALRAPALVIYSGARGGHTNNHARRLLKSALKELLAAASEQAVCLALKPMHPGCASECTFLTSLQETESLLEELDSPHLKLAFDSYHFGFEASTLDDLPRLAPRIALVQLGDAKQPPQGEQNRCRLGDGVIPLQRMVGALSAGGYRGYFEVKLIGEDVEPYDYRELIQHSKTMFASWGLPQSVP